MCDISENAPSLIIDETLNSEDAKKTEELVNALAEESDMMARMQEEKDKLLKDNNVSIGQSGRDDLPTGSTEVFGSYSTDSLAEETAKYRNINIQESKDALGRTFLRFFDGKTTSLICVIFTLQNRILVSLNDRVIPLSELLNAREIEEVPVTTQQVASHDLRSMLDIKVGDVIVRVQEQRGYMNLVEKTYTFKNTTVSLMMMALSRLGALYKELVATANASAATSTGCVGGVPECKVAEGATKGIMDTA